MVVLAETEKTTFRAPVPDAPDVIDTHDTELDAEEAHPFWVRILIVPVAAGDVNWADDGEMP